jgi:hypothetical protein
MNATKTMRGKESEVCDKLIGCPALSRVGEWRRRSRRSLEPECINVQGLRLAARLTMNPGALMA